MPETDKEMADKLRSMRERSRSRSAEYRRQKTEAGFIQATFWLPKDKAERMRKSIQGYIDNIDRPK